MIQPSNPFPSHVHIIARGITWAASRTSSAMCAPASTPTKELVALVRPRMTASGIFPHIILSSKTVKTSLEEWLLSLMTQSGITTAKNPATCSMTTPPSINGRWRERYVLNTKHMARTAQMRSVPCHAFGMYDGLFKMMRPWICLPERYETVAAPVCQPRTPSQPTR